MNRCLLVVAFLVGLSVSGFGQEAGNVSSPCASFPCIVASISLINQTASVSHVPIYTPTTSGLFRVTYYLESDIHGIGGFWIFSWNWTDDLKTETPSPIYLEPGGYLNYGVPGMRVLAGHPITYTVTNEGHGGSYSLFATVEQLQ
jgi:hypothetical protein